MQNLNSADETVGCVGLKTTKRKSLENKAFSKSKLRKRVASSASEASTDTITIRNARNSPLLRLPPELRDRIWKDILGERRIYVEYNNNDDELDFETDDIYHMGYQDSLWRNVVYEPNCPEDRNCQCVYDDAGETTLNLAILRTYRQTYIESNRILWTTNIFCFSNGTTLRRFMTTTTGNQKRLIRNLRLRMEWTTTEIMLWNSALNNEFVENWSGLRSLRLQILHDLDELDWSHLKDKQHYLQKIGNHCRSLRKLSHLPLTSAEVSIHGRVWSQSERDRMANDLRKMFLGQSGFNVSTEAQRKAKERHPKD
ncbi:MAG: hypothetical protein Q9209_007223 [Squamulea sp. 1 TL-2023]